MSEYDQTYSPERSPVGRFVETRRLENMSMLGLASFRYYRGLLGRVEAAGGIVAYSREKDLDSERVRELLFSLSWMHAHPIASGRDDQRKAANRIPDIQRALECIFDLHAAEPDFTILEHADITRDIFTAPHMPYDLSGGLREIMTLENFLPLKTVWEMYDYIAGVRTHRLLQQLIDDDEVPHSFLIIHSITRQATFPNDVVRDQMRTALHHDSPLAFQLGCTVYRDQLGHLLSTLAGPHYGSQRVADVVAFVLQNYQLGSVSITGVGVDEQGGLVPVELLSEQKFIQHIQQAFL